jgi:hypothetical protein
LRSYTPPGGCGFSSLMSNSHSKCPLDVQMDSEVRFSKLGEFFEESGVSVNCGSVRQGRSVWLHPISAAGSKPRSVFGVAAAAHKAGQAHRRPQSD